MPSIKPHDTPQNTRYCTVCGIKFLAFPSSTVKTCGDRECVSKSRRISIGGKPYKRNGVLGNGANLEGRVFGRLRCIEATGTKNRKILWRCECECGNTCYVKSDALLNGNTKSCGCLRAETLTPEAHKKSLASNIQYGTHLGKIRSTVLPKNNTSGARGVIKQSNGRWRAIIGFKHRLYHLGTFDTLEEAIAARLEGEDRLWGSFLAWYDANKHNNN